MAGLAKTELHLAQPLGWLDQLAALLARELAPSAQIPHRLSHHPDCDDRLRSGRDLSRQQRSPHLHRLAPRWSGTHDVFSEGGYVPDRGGARACFISCDGWNIGGNALAYTPVSVRISFI